MEKSFVASFSLLLSDPRYKEKALETYRKYISHLTSRLGLGITAENNSNSNSSSNSGSNSKNSSLNNVNKTSILDYNKIINEKIRLIISASSILNEKIHQAEIASVKKLFTYWLKSYYADTYKEGEFMLESIRRALEAINVNNLSTVSSPSSPMPRHSFLEEFAASIHSKAIKFGSSKYASTNLFVSSIKIAVLIDERDRLDKIAINKQRDVSPVTSNSPTELENCKISFSLDDKEWQEAIVLNYVKGKHLLFIEKSEKKR